MPIKTTIHSIDTNSKSAIVTIVDGDDAVLNYKNIGIELNNSGTANTDWLILYSKYTVYHHRLMRIEKTEDDLVCGKTNLF